MALAPRPLAERFWPKVAVRGPDDCWEWMGGKIMGYGNIRTGGRDAPHKRAHVVSYEITYGPVPDGLQINHKCDNKGCCNPGHIYAGTAKQNAADRSVRGRHNSPRGARHGMAKLNEGDIISIRCDDRSQAQVATDYGVVRSLIGMIKRGERWGHVATKSAATQER